MATIQTQGMENRKAHSDAQRLLRTPAGRAAEVAPADMMQRAFGNRALGYATAARGESAAMLAHPASVVQRARLVVQPRLTLGPVDDVYEREADSVASRVVQSMDAAQGQPVQRQEEEEELQMKAAPGTVQRAGPEEEEELQMKPALATVQRAGPEEEEELQAKHSAGPAPAAIDPALEAQIQRARAGGSALESAARTGLESAMGSDFGGVRIHTDPQSDALNRSLNARAFTTGSDIFFRSGEYNPGTAQGKELLAHELTHVVQQGAASVRAKRLPNALQRKRASHELFFGATFA